MFGSVWHVCLLDVCHVCVPSLIAVFEYVPDSEEASQSQTESVMSSGKDDKKDVSEDELEFLERTQAFIANMQKLRQEIRDEQVEEEEVEMTEHFQVRANRSRMCCQQQ